MNDIYEKFKEFLMEFCAAGCGLTICSECPFGLATDDDHTICEKIISCTNAIEEQEVSYATPQP